MNLIVMTAEIEKALIAAGVAVPDPLKLEAVPRGDVHVLTLPPLPIGLERFEEALIDELRKTLGESMNLIVLPDGAKIEHVGERDMKALGWVRA